MYYTKDGKITNVYDSNDAVILDDKTPDPKYFGSFGARVAYKGIELNADFYFSGGNYIYNHNRFFTESDGAQIGQNLDKSLLYDQWKQPGDITNVPRQDLNNSAYMSTRYLEDGSYMRLRNLFTITNFRGLDPEVGDSPTTGLAATAGPAAAVLDFSFPASRTIMFGIEIGF